MTNDNTPFSHTDSSSSMYFVVLSRLVTYFISMRSRQLTRDSVPAAILKNTHLVDSIIFEDDIDSGTAASVVHFTHLNTVQCQKIWQLSKDLCFGLGY